MRPLSAIQATQGRAAAQGKAAAQGEALKPIPTPSLGAGLGAVLAALGAGLYGLLGLGAGAFYGWGLGLFGIFILAFLGSAFVRGRNFSLLGLGLFLFFLLAFRLLPFWGLGKAAFSL